jgi:hypothetical protein
MTPEGNPFFPAVTPAASPEASPPRAAEPIGSRSPAPFIPRELWLDDLNQAPRPQASWLWRGYLAPGNVTLLTSQWKAGKTTLLSILLSRLKTGGLLAGLPLTPGKAVVVSEESPERWRERSQKLDFGNHVCWYCRPFQGKPSSEQWLALLDRLAELHSRHNLNLVAIDPLSSFFPGRGESNAERMLEFLSTLQRLTALGLAVLLLHHPSKAETAAGLLARGSGALSAFVDILIEMTWHRSPSDTDRRRRLLAFSRSDETPRQLVVELTAEGTDYLGLGSFVEEEFTENWKRLLALLQSAPKKLTRTQIVRRWPLDSEAPTGVTLWRWLERAVGQGLLLREGTGRKNDPFRYWLPGQEEKWKTPPWQAEMDRFIERINAGAFADPPGELPPPPPGGPANA